MYDIFQSERRFGLGGKVSIELFLGIGIKLATSVNNSQRSSKGVNWVLSIGSLASLGFNKA